MTIYINGSSGDDILTGNHAINRMFGAEGDDTIYGGAGNDTLNGGAGNDTLDGGNGNDTLNGGAGRDTLDGDTGNDILTGGSAGDSFILHATNNGADVITDFEDGTDKITLLGFRFDDLTIQADAEGQGAMITWDGGQAHLQGVDHTALTAEDFFSSTLGTAADDTLEGGAGADILTGGAGDDTFVFASFDGDTITDFGTGNDRIRITAEGVGFDDLTINPWWNNLLLQRLFLRSESGVLIIHLPEEDINTTVITWNGGSLTLTGVADTELTAADFIFTEAPAEPAPEPEPAPVPEPEPQQPAQNTHEITASTPSDAYVAKYAFNRIVADGTVRDVTGDTSQDNPRNFRDHMVAHQEGSTLRGKKGRDWLEGSSGDDFLSGGNARDWLVGGRGGDRLQGGAQDDILTGNQGRDTFIFRTDHGADIITDFEVGKDKIVLDGDSAEFSDLTIKKWAKGTGAKIEWDEGTIHLESVQRDALTEDSFEFA